MAVKSQVLLGVILAIVLLTCQDTVHARELTQANNNDLNGNMEPPVGPVGLKEKKTLVNVGIYPDRPFGAYGGGFPPFGGGIGGLGNGLGFGGGIVGPGNDLGFGLPGLVPGGFNNFNGFGGFGGFQQGVGVPGF